MKVRNSVGKLKSYFIIIYLNQSIFLINLNIQLWITKARKKKLLKNYAMIYFLLKVRKLLPILKKSKKMLLIFYLIWIWNHYKNIRFFPNHVISMICFEKLASWIFLIVFYI